jgi:hypothetical protein
MRLPRYARNDGVSLINQESPRSQPGGLFLLAVGLCLAACKPAVTNTGNSPGPAVLQFAADPLAASYEIEGEPVTLVDGQAEWAAAPGSASRVQTRILGDPVAGDLDGDGVDDAVSWMLRQTGGTGSFYYLAAALNHAGGYQGSSAVLLGDRIAPAELTISNGVVRASYRGRKPNEAMATRPAIRKTAYFTFVNYGLAPVGPLAAGEEMLQGWLVSGHEVRQFRPCSEMNDLWLQGTSAGLQELLAAHRDALANARPYMPLFVTVVGRRVAAPATGFGAAYSAGLDVTRLVRAWPQGNCSSDRIIVQAPLPGATVHSALVVRGQARGNWFFEGDFPLLLLDRDRNVLARSYASALGEWMSDAFVPFEGVLEFEPPPGATTGWLVLQKDNPSERPELDEVLELPVGFD